MNSRLFQLPNVVLPAFLLWHLSACGGSESDDDSSSPTPADAPTATPVPVVDLPDTLSFSDDTWPEDVIVYDNRVFVSNFVYGGIETLDIHNPSVSATQFVPEETASNLTSWWGLKADSKLGLIVVVANAFYVFDGNVAEQGEVRAYDAATGSLKKTWKLPDGAVGNSLVIGGDGSYYIGDVGPTARIIRVSADSDQVTVWKEDSSLWDAAAVGGFGLGGMDYNGKDAFYAVFGGSLWLVPVNSDGSAGDLQVVELTMGGSAFESVRADGMSWAGQNSLYYAQNDVFQPGPQGVLYQVRFDGPADGEVVVAESGLKDPSGVFAASLSGKDYVFVNESQYGHLFGVDTGYPELPFEVLVFEQ